MQKNVMLKNLCRIHFFLSCRTQLQCIARIYDIYEKDVVKYVEEQYPRILANSDNGGVHFSFISDRDAAGKILFYFLILKFILLPFLSFSIS